MSVAELKSNIINQISTTEDLIKLEQITEILGIKNPKTESIYVFNPEQRKQILKSLDQVAAGNVMSEEEAERDIQKWLE